MHELVPLIKAFPVRNDWLQGNDTIQLAMQESLCSMILRMPRFMIPLKCRVSQLMGAAKSHPLLPSCLTLRYM